MEKPDLTASVKIRARIADGELITYATITPDGQITFERPSDASFTGEYSIGPLEEHHFDRFPFGALLPPVDTWIQETDRKGIAWRVFRLNGVNAPADGKYNWRVSTSSPFSPPQS
jgi:hypothetical protein